MGTLYLIGAVALNTPGGLNPQDVVEEFGGDFAVKPVVGARQPREAVGPSDDRLVISGTIFPFRQAAAGVGSGLAEIDTLRAYAASQESLPVMRGDGRNMGFFILEKVQVKNSRLAKQGIGRVQEFALQLVRVPDGPSPPAALTLFTGLVTFLGQVGK